MENIFSFYKFKLNELLFNTMSPEQTINQITTNIYKLNNDNIENGDFTLDFEGRFMIIYLKNKYEDLEKIYAILSTIYSTGYFISQYFVSTNLMKNYLLKSEEDFIKNIKRKNILDFTFRCEPKNDITVSVPDKIYHITPISNTQNILKHGLLPSSGKKKGFHPHRNYFCTSINDVEDMKKSINLQSLIISHKISKTPLLFDLLEIDTTNLKSTGFDGEEYNIKFFKDENSKGIWTWDLIPPDKIKKIVVKSIN